MCEIKYLCVCVCVCVDVGLPQVQFISPEVAVSENAVDQPEACVILIGGPLFVNEAVLNINSFPGSALGMYNIE